MPLGTSCEVRFVGASGNTIPGHLIEQFSSEDSNIISTNDRTIIANKVGETIITAKTRTDNRLAEADRNISGTMKIKVVLPDVSKDASYSVDVKTNGIILFNIISL